MSKNNKKIIKIIIIIVIIAVVAALLFKYKHQILHVKHKIIHMDARFLKRYILSYGKFSAVAFIVFYGLKPIAFIIPASLLSILAGNIFGPWIATILSLIGCFFAGTVAFYLAKILGKPFVDKILKGKALKLDSSIEKHGFIIMLLMRLSVVFPYDALSYAAGLTKMKYRDFILGTVIGVIPEMTTYSLIGNGLEHPSFSKFIIPIVLVAIVAFSSYYVYKRYKEKF